MSLSLYLSTFHCPTYTLCVPLPLPSTAQAFSQTAILASMEQDRRPLSNSDVVCGRCRSRLTDGEAHPTAPGPHAPVEHCSTCAHPPALRPYSHNERKALQRLLGNHGVHTPLQDIPHLPPGVRWTEGEYVRCTTSLAARIKASAPAPLSERDRLVKELAECRAVEDREKASAYLPFPGSVAPAGTPWHEDVDEDVPTPVPTTAPATTDPLAALQVCVLTGPPVSITRSSRVTPPQIYTAPGYTPPTTTNHLPGS